MKKDFLYKREDLPAYSGVADYISKSVSESNAGTSELTEESLQRAIDYLNSPERKEEERRAAIMRHNSEGLLWAALQQKVLTENEYWYLSLFVQMNGMLIVTKEYYDKLKNVDFKGIDL